MIEDFKKSELTAMAGTKEIRVKIKSVQNTRKITKAMEMVAASKMRKAQERMRAGRPYARGLLAITAHAASANTEYRHPLLTRRPRSRTSAPSSSRPTRASAAASTRTCCGSC